MLRGKQMLMEMSSLGQISLLSERCERRPEKPAGMMRRGAYGVFLSAGARGLHQWFSTLATL